MGAEDGWIDGGSGAFLTGAAWFPLRCGAVGGGRQTPLPLASRAVVVRSLLQGVQFLCITLSHESRCKPGLARSLSPLARDFQ
jgi:hypothetical protein